MNHRRGHSAHLIMTDDHSDIEPNQEHHFPGQASRTSGESDKSGPEIQRSTHSPAIGWIRFALAALACPLLIWYGYFSVFRGAGQLGFAGAIVLLLGASITAGFRSLRILVLVIMTINLLSMVINPVENFGKPNPIPTKIPDVILVVGLAIASLIEINAWIQENNRQTVTRFFSWAALSIPALYYIIGIPVFDAIVEAFSADTGQMSTKDPGWKWWNESAFRTAKFCVFLAFSYLGACLGSFLNVVAYCVPRREAIGIRDSKCPQCETKISRKDNLPVFSYINLGARCRNCREPISFRYLFVELLVAAIFGSLFLYQLVTSSANVPLTPTFHTGILWIILYPKWPAIGLYLFHVFWMSLVVVFALMEWDRQPFRKSFAFGIASLFCVMAIVYLPLQPIPVTEHLPVSKLGFAVWVSQLLKVLAGIGAGAIMGYCFRAMSTERFGPFFVFVAVLSGSVVGWQAWLQVTAIFTAMIFAVAFSPWVKDRLRDRSTSILLFAILIHHPFWQTIANGW
ncbi:MAG: prepilin peptidase [Planctomycetota bacterium]